MKKDTCQLSIRTHTYDVCRLMTTYTKEEYLYLVIFIYGYTQYGYLYLMKYKFEAF